MLPLQNQQRDQKRIVEVLARDSNAPVAEVARLYEAEQAELEIGARIKSFLPIFAIRNVREILRRRSSVSHAAQGEGRAYVDK